MNSRLVSSALAVVLTLVAGCGYDGDSASPTPHPETPLASGPRGEVSLPEGAFLTAYGDGAATFPSDQPGLAAGDFNDDGFDDFVAGARFADPEGRQDAGAAYIVFGAADLSGERDFAAGEQDLTILGAGEDDGLGYAAASGDLDGDGADDLVLGAPFASGSGAAYIFFGPVASGEIDLAAQAADVTLSLSDQPAALFGDSLAAGDVNGDGTADLLAGAPFSSNPSGVPGGAVFAFFGRTDWSGEVTSPDVSFFGTDQFDELGDYVIAADLNGDGVDDIVATAEAADGPDNARNTSAEVHAIFGGTGLSGTYDTSSGTPNLSVYGAAENDTLGFALAAADLDSDGDDDLAMSARLATPPGGAGSEGIVYILPGNTKLPNEIDLARPSPDIVTISGTDPGALFATSLTDLPPSPHALVLGGSLVDTGGVDAGAVYVLAPGLPASGAIADLAQTTFAGSEVSGHVGSNVVSGDFNGDGQPDLAIVAELESGPDESRPDAGRVYLVTP